MSEKIRVLIGEKWIRFRVWSLNLIKELPSGWAEVSIGKIIGYIKPHDVPKLKSNLMARNFIKWMRGK